MITLLQQQQFLPVSLEKAWNYFSSPHNLNELIPDDITLKIISHVPEKMYEGLILNYKVSPILNIPLNWCTEITHVRELHYFIDEQRKGPYKMWHHEHHFKEAPGGVDMIDILHYDIGKGIFGSVAGKLFVHKKVKQIFEYRRKKLETMFGNK